MAHPNHKFAYAYFDAVTAGELPDALLTPDMTAWLTTAGTIDKASYQGAIRLLARMCAQPIRFTVNAVTAEDDRVVAEAESEAVLIDGQSYRNTYVFVLRIRGDRICAIAEHYNALIVQEKLFPLMEKLTAGETA
jgi:ketosteroid isomerase-like protein